MKTVISFLFLFGVGLAHAADALDKLRAYEGSWKTQTENFDTPYSKAGKESAALKNECWRSAGFFACDQFVNGESKALVVFTYNSKDDVYRSYPIPADGGGTGTGKLVIKDNVWTFPWEDKDAQGKIYFQVVNVFTAPGRIEYRREFSRDQAHWTVMAKGHEEKQQ
jgi:hypothetical protein